MLKLSVQPGEEEKGLLGKLLDKLRALFRKKQRCELNKNIPVITF